MKSITPLYEISIIMLPGKTYSKDVRLMAAQIYYYLGYYIGVPAGLLRMSE